jgi:peptide-methionine (S)-S-oxide reductase
VGDIVTIDYQLTPEGDFVAEPLFDMHGEYTFVLGGGNYLPGIHQLIQGLKEGESVTGALIDAGWGERSPGLIAELEKENFPEFDKYEIGTVMWLKTGHKCHVTDKTDQSFTIDCNPPLAGASYKCDLKLLRVDSSPNSSSSSRFPTDRKYEIATFGLGCFWGGELAFMRELGVVGSKVGYSQGETEAPTYDQVCTGTTGHTEAIQVIFDPLKVSFQRLCELAMERLGDSAFLLNQVGSDEGTQYRHGVYYHSEEQREVAQKVLARFGDSCATEIKPSAKFWDAEDYHQQYLLKGGQSAKKGATQLIRCYG